MPAVSRTIGPLHFEDLEPKRFEDLIRQLIYEFRTWRRLEATGRAGSDDGFDARGLEIVVPDEDGPVATDDDGEDTSSEIPDRLWLIQCKRERAIGPKKLVEYLDNVTLAPDESLYGLIFAAACDFSKKSHDRFREKCRERGIQVAHLWGKGELEDMLFQPKNDHLLFGYFGFSLTIRQRTRSTELRRQITTKKRLRTLTQNSYNQRLLIRNALGDIYPSVPPNTKFSENHWRLCEFEELSHRGLLIEWARFLAVIDNGPVWDAADSAACCWPRLNIGFWNGDAENTARYDEASAVWDGFEKENRGWLLITGCIPYDRIIAIDDCGDEVFSGPQVFCRYERGSPLALTLGEVRPNNSQIERFYVTGPDDSRRTRKFPAQLRSAEANAADASRT